MFNFLDLRKENYKRSSKSNFTIRFHYKRKDNNYDGWNFWMWKRDQEGKDWDSKTVQFSSEDSFGKVLSICVKDEGLLNKLGFLIRKSSTENQWEKKDTEQDRYIPLLKDKKNIDVYIMQDEKEIFFNEEEALEYLKKERLLKKREEKKTEKMTVKFHYNRFEEDYNGWDIWLWNMDKLGFESDGVNIQFNKEDEFGKYAEFEIDKTEDLTDLGFIIKRYGWAERDVYMNRYASLKEVNEKGELEVFVIQGEDKVVYRKEDVDRSPRILKSVISGEDQIYVLVNYPFDIGKEKLDGFILKDEEKEIKIKEVSCIGHKTFKIITEEKLSVNKTYMLYKNGYKESHVSLENYYDSKEFKDEFSYKSDDLGVTYTKDNCKFKLWTPTASKVKVCIYDQGIGGKCISELEMAYSKNGVWELDIQEDLNGKFYTYKVENYGREKEAVDPYAKAVGINGERGAIVNLLDTNPPGWDKDKSPELENIEDSIIYEAHVRDLTIDKNSGVKNRGKFLGLTEQDTVSKEGEKTGISHLKELGITHLHLLPIFDFSGVNERAEDGKTYNWGYNPENYNVPEGSYSTDASNPLTRIKECKQAVKALHENGIRVIMDVVYNHTAKTEESNFNKIIPGYYHRKLENGTFSNGSGCGNETSSEREMTKKMIIDSLKHWVNEYHIDGFRFDLMGLHDVDLMNEIRQEMDKIKPNIILYGEGWTGYEGSLLPYHKQARRENARWMNGVGTFNDTLRDAVKGANSEDREKEPGFVNGAWGKEDLIRVSVVASTNHPQVNNYFSRADQPIKTINYVSAHDNLTLWDKLACTNKWDAEEERIKMDKLSAAIVMTCQGIPFIHGGEEFLRTKQGVHNSYKSSDEINKFDWYRKTKYIDVNNYYRRLITLRKQHPAFRIKDADVIRKNLIFMDNIHTPNVVGYTLNNHVNGDPYRAMAVVFNANANWVKINLPRGRWAVVLDGRKDEITKLECVENNELWLPGRTAIILGDAESVEKDLRTKEKLRKVIKKWNDVVEEKKEQKRKSSDLKMETVKKAFDLWKNKVLEKTNVENIERLI